MDYFCKKLFNGFASVRDTAISRCIHNGQSLVIHYDGERMTIPLEKLIDPDKFQIHRKKFKSKYDGARYELYDFVFVPDDRQQKLFN